MPTLYRTTRAWEPSQRPAKEVGDEPERPQPLLLIGTPMALLAQLLVLEVTSLDLTERQQAIPENARLTDGAAGIVDAVGDKEIRLHPLREVDGRAIPPELGVRLGVTHLISEEVLEVRH